MKNILLDISPELSTIDYTPILKKIEQNLEKIEIQSTKSAIRFNNLATLSASITKQLSSESITKLLNIDTNKKPSYVTLNHKSPVEFSENIKRLYENIKASSITIDTPLSDMKNTTNQSYQSYQTNKTNKTNQPKVNFGVNYFFRDTVLNKQLITFEKGHKLDESLRIDYVEIKIDINEVSDQLKKNIEDLLTQDMDDEQELDERVEDIHDGKYGVQNMIDILNNNSLARIKRTISYLYMDYLLKNYAQKEQVAVIDYKLATNYVKRFILLEDYLKQLVTESQQNQKITVEQFEYNLCNLLCEGHAFDAVPFIGKVDGILLEDRTEESKVFKIALKMKLNGTVASTGQSSLLYNISQMRKELEEGKTDKVIRKLFLFTFLLLGLDNDEYDPVQMWKSIKDNIQKGNIKKLIERLHKRLIQDKDGVETIRQLGTLFTNITNYRASTLKMPSVVYEKNLVLYKGALDDDYEQGDVFRPVQRNTEYLQDIAVVDRDGADKSYLINMPININIQSKSLYKTGEADKTTISYITDQLKVLPVIFYPDNKDLDLSQAREKIKNIFTIKIPYLEDEILSNVIYSTVYTTLVYMLLEKHLNRYGKDLYIPIMRIHSVKQTDKVDGIRNIGKVLENILNNKYRAMSQGFKYDANDAEYRYYNAVSSMYNGVPRRVALSNVGKVAVIAVTSRKCDSSYSTKHSINLLIGEVILVGEDKGGNIVCDMWRTFSDYYSEDKLYNNPVIIADVINEIYNMGYKQIIYVAKTPYSSQINITDTIQNMFFMNEDVLKMILEDKKDLEVYPVYFEQFMARNCKEGVEALYVSDTKEMNKHITNNHKAIMEVLNLYSGKNVSTRNRDRYYASVVIYSTLYNMYKDETINKRIYKGLIENTATKEKLIEALITLHYMRYEAHNNKTIKINPYNRLIGDDGVASKSILEDEKHLRFNLLAYLTDVRKVLEGGK